MSNKHQIVDEIIKILDNDINIVGFVSPSHQVVQMIEIINEINKKGYNPTIVYNSNGYDKVETLKELENVVDVYLPDLKYYNNQIAFRYSGIKNYFEVASMAIKEMYRQKGASIVLNDKNLIEFGLIIRHLVLPTHADDSINLLKFLANNISNRLYISLMSQYYPPKDLLLPNELKENLSTNEYKKVVKIIEDLGFRGWIQEAESQSHYKPNFDNDIPFSE
jgi:putative pyruvate formate lyase activating enzyme